MFIIRTAFWLGLVIFLLPSDKESRERLAVAATNVYSQVSTVCDRQPDLCEKGAVAWGMFKTQAQTAGRAAFDLAMDRLAPRGKAGSPSPAHGLEPAVFDAKPASHVPAVPQGTLRDEDLAPRWRGDQARGRL